MSTKFRILSLDGGGSWALIQVRALQAIYGDPDKKGHEILSDFDMVAANSGGSIVLGALIENKKLSEILAQFTDYDQRIKLFAPLGLDHLADKALEAIVHMGPKYSASRKLIGLKQLLPTYGTVKLNELGVMSNNRSWPKLLICTYDYDLQRATFFRSDINSLATEVNNQAQPTLAEAIHASSNAPVNYFDAPAIFPGNIDFTGKRYWDGGVGGHNNPILAAVTETISNRSTYLFQKESICALSIGTGITELPQQGKYPTDSAVLVSHQESTRLLTDVKKLATSILADPPDAATFVSHFILNGAPRANASNSVSGNLIRLNPVVRPILKDNKWSLPIGISEEDFEKLVGLDMDAIQNAEVDLIGKFCENWINDNVPNQAIQNDSNSNPLIGHVSFTEAIKNWNNILNS